MIKLVYIGKLQDIAFNRVSFTLELAPPFTVFTCHPRSGYILCRLVFPE